MIGLVTSIPPELSRRDPSGAEIGRRYRRRCLESWRALGFEAHSVNSPDEIALIQDDLPVTFQSIGRDARLVTGRPHVFFHDVICAGRDLGTDQVMIINSDILLQPRFHLPRLVSSVEPGTALVSKRVDIADIERLEGKRFYYGFDFFVLHRDDLQRVEEAGLIFGMPWWDYYLLSVLCLQGVRIDLIEDQFVYHLKHDERWDDRQWYDIGCRYIHVLKDRIARSGPHGARPRPAAFAEAIDSALAPPPLPIYKVKQRLRRLLAPTKFEEKRIRKVLGRICDTTVEYMDRNFTVSAERAMPRKRAGE